MVMGNDKNCYRHMESMLWGWRGKRDFPSTSIHWIENKRKGKKSWTHKNDSVSEKQSKSNSVAFMDTRTAELKVASHIP